MSEATEQVEQETVQKETGAADTLNYEAEMLKAFVQKPEKYDWYRNAFAKIDANGGKFTWVWSWWALFGGVFFYLYRKAYIPALVFFAASIVASFIPFGGLVIWIANGGVASFFVYKRYQEMKRLVEAQETTPEKRIEAMKLAGGYNTWAIVLGVIINVLFFLFMFMGLAMLGAAMGAAGAAGQYQ